MYEFMHKDMNEIYPEDVIIFSPANEFFFHWLLINPHYQKKLQKMGFGAWLDVDKRGETYPNNEKCTGLDDIVGILYRYLAIPSPSLQKKLDQFREENFDDSSGSLCFHFRFGPNKGGDFKIDSTGPLFSKRGINWFWRCAEHYK